MRRSPMDLVAALARRSWIAGVLCVLVCASLAARTAGHVIEAELLADPTVAAPRPTVAPPPPATVSGGSASALVSRNVFCSDCPPPGAGDPTLSSAEPVTARLPLMLVATSLARARADSYATIINVESGAQGAFWTGQHVPGAGILEHVAGTYVEVRTDAGALGRIELLSAPIPVAAAKVEPAAGKSAPPAAAWADRVKAIDDHTFEIDRELLRELVGGQGKMAGVRAMPVGKGGKLSGVRLSGARKDSLAAAVGLRNADVIEAIDGTALDSTDALLTMYGKLDSASQVSVSITRGGKPVELQYRLR